MLNFQTLFESIPGLYLVYSLDLMIVGGSDAYFQATKTKREEIVGRHLFEVFPDNPDDPNANGVENLRTSLEKVLKHHQPHTMAVQKYDIRRLESAGGGLEERYWKFTNSPVFDQNGEMTHIIQQVEDVTEFVQLQQFNQSLQNRTQIEIEISTKAQELNPKSKKDQNNLKLANIRKQAIQALQASDQQLQLVLRTSRIGFWQLDLKTNILSTSDQCKVNFGLSIDADFSHQVLMTSIHPDDRTSVQAAIQDSITNHTDYDVEYRTIWDDRSTHWVLVRGFTIYDADGTPLEMVGTSLDITDRKQTEEALRESEARFRSFAENSNDVVWITTAHEYRLIYVSPAYEQIWGRSITELFVDLTRFVEFVHPDDRDRIQAGWQRCTEGGFSQEYRVIRPDGSIIWIYDRGFPIYDDQGKLLYLGGIAEDISDRKHAEDTLLEISAELERQVRKFDAIASSVPDFIYTFDLSGRFT